MQQLNIFIDGSWLYKTCNPQGVLAAKTDRPNYPFVIDFEKLNKTLLRHVRKNTYCHSIGSLYYATSIFRLPEQITDLGDLGSDSKKLFKGLERNIHGREKVADDALAAGYSKELIFRPSIRAYHIENIIKGDHQEKLVDTAIAALSVRRAYTNPSDINLIISGDADVLMAIKIAHPKFLKRVCIAATHNDEMNENYQKMSYSFQKLKFKIDPFYLQDNIIDIIQGENVYSCFNCRKVFTTIKPIPPLTVPYCSQCRN